MKLTEQAIVDFQETVWRYYDQAGRDLPWRHTNDAYKIMVSEIMLQQTQVPRVIPKYQAFLELFPDVTALADASLDQVLRAWQGLGYNRRARFLWLAAQKVVSEYSGVMPKTVEGLKALPGIGYNTACAIVAYSYDMPVVFVETNIRTVFIHHFFNDQTDITDTQILELVAQTLPNEEGKRAAGDLGFAQAPRDEKKPQVLSHTREWYWALMDYGSYLKATIGNVSRNSKHYVKQSVFQGSKRQIRGQVIRLLTDRPYSVSELRQQIADPRLGDVLSELADEGMICTDGTMYRL